MVELDRVIQQAQNAELDRGTILKAENALRVRSDNYRIWPMINNLYAMIDLIEDFTALGVLPSVMVQGLSEVKTLMMEVLLELDKHLEQGVVLSKLTTSVVDHEGIDGGFSASGFNNQVGGLPANTTVNTFIDGGQADSEYPDTSTVSLQLRGLINETPKTINRLNLIKVIFDAIGKMPASSIVLDEQKVLFNMNVGTYMLLRRLGLQGLAVYNPIPNDDVVQEAFPEIQSVLGNFASVLVTNDNVQTGAALQAAVASALLNARDTRLERFLSALQLQLKRQIERFNTLNWTLDICGYLTVWTCYMDMSADDQYLLNQGRYELGLAESALGAL